MASLAAINLGAISSSGVTLALPHSTGMQSSLPLLKKNYKFSKVCFWGKLMGITGDYLIAMGIEESYTKAKFFYCQDGVSWAQLPAVTEEMLVDCGKIESVKQVSGDIAMVYTLPAEPLPEDAEEGAEPPEPKTVTELTRLAVMVTTIDSECAMLPVGALLKKPDGSVVDSPTYTGLDFGKATTLKSYALVHKPKDVSVNADALTAATDFLATADEIVPQGALVSKFDESLNMVTWRSLLFPGFLAYSLVGGPMQGYCYFGTGERNADIAFMLP